MEKRLSDYSNADKAYMRIMRHNLFDKDVVVLPSSGERITGKEIKRLVRENK